MVKKKKYGRYGVYVILQTTVHILIMSIEMGLLKNRVICWYWHRLQYTCFIKVKSVPI